MRKLFTLKNGRSTFYACVWDCGMYSIERITKSFGGTVATFETLEELKKYAKENIHNMPDHIMLNDEQVKDFCAFIGL